MSVKSTFMLQFRLLLVACVLHLLLFWAFSGLSLQLQLQYGSFSVQRCFLLCSAWRSLHAFYCCTSLLWENLGDAPSQISPCLLTSTAEGFWSSWSMLCGAVVVEVLLLLHSGEGQCPPSPAFGSASS